MKKYLFLILFLVPTLTMAQGPIAQEINQLLQSGEVKKAEQKVGEYLRKNPKEVDAIMMKGNVIFNKGCCEEHLTLSANVDESIYSSSIGFLGNNGPMIASREVGTQVAELWKQAVALDLQRRDIHFGICHIYSISMMTDELIEYLPTLKRYVTDDDKLHYSMCDYARNLKDRGDFKSAMRVYEYIFTLFPEQIGLLSDIAAEYFIYGDMALAKKNIDVAVKSPGLDEMSLGNAFYFNSVLGEYETALSCLKRQSEATGTDEYLFYEGWINYKDGGNWKSSMNEYIKTAQNSDWKQMAEFMTNSAYSGSPDDYKRLLEFRTNDALKILIHQTFKTKNPNEWTPHFNYAELLTHNKVYDVAASAFQEIQNSPITQSLEEKERTAYHYGWVLWQLNRRAEAVKQWEKIKDSEDFTYKSASAYFIGKYHYDKGSKQTAKEYFGSVSDRASESKYATMAWNYYKELK